MDQKKAVIIGSIVTVLLGAAVFTIVLIRSRTLSEETVPPPADLAPSVVPEGTTASGRGSLQSSGGSSQGSGGTQKPPSTATSGAAAKPATTVDAAVKDTGCDTSNDAIDCDYDHLTNGEEKKYKTDPLKYDTDGDGVGDSNEINAWKTDPLNPRSVDPTMTDLEAINAGKKNPR